MNAWAQRAAPFLAQLQGDGPSRLLRNAAGVTMALHTEDGRPVPLLVVPAFPGNASILSTAVHYVAYPAESILQRWLPSGASGVLVALGLWALRLTQIDRAVLLDQWLTSVGPGLRLSEARWETMISTVANRWPGHAVVARAITPALDPDQLSTLVDLGGIAIPRRVVHVYDPRLDRSGPAFQSWRKRVSRARRKLEAAAPRALSDKGLTAADVESLADLYDQQALGRHSHFNPAYTAAFFEAITRVDGVRLTRWYQDPERTGSPTGFALALPGHDRLFWTLFGADQSAGWDPALYEIITADLMEVANDMGVPLNLGSTADTFKRFRDARPSWEWDVVFVGHLPWYRRAPWWLLAGARRRMCKNATVEG